MTIGDLTPTNLHQELEKFRADHRYNPQFTYAKEIDPAFMISWGQPDPQIARIADHLIDVSGMQTHAPLEHHAYSEEEIVAAVENHLSHLPSEMPPLPVFFNPNQIPRCRITTAGLFFRTNLSMTKADFDGLLRHEIDTHFLRHFNQVKNNLNRFELSDKGRTEEGLATLNNYLFHPRPLIVKSALRYKAAVLGQEQSFAGIYQSLSDLKVSPREALRAALRVKRGLTDTSQPGVTTKDIIYLEGTIKVMRWLQSTQTKLSNLYVGQISLEHLAALGDVSNYSQIAPSYIAEQDQYLTQLQKIIEYNQLTDLL